MRFPPRLWKAMLAVTLLLRFGAAGMGQSRTAALDALRQRLLTDGGEAVVRIGGIHAATKVLLRPIDNRIVDGAVQQRAVAGMFRTQQDRVLPVGQPVRVVKVDSSGDTKGDILRVTVMTPDGAQALLAFPMAPGALATMSSEALQEAVGVVLRPLGTPADAAAGANRAAANAPARRPVPANAWRLQRTPTGPEVLLLGSLESNGAKSPALLAFGCPTGNNLMTGGTAGTPVMELRFRRSEAHFESSEISMEGGADNDYGRSQVGTAPEIHIDLSSDPDQGEGPVLPLALGYDLPEFQKVLAGAGSELVLKVHVPKAPSDALVARFALPADVGPVEQMMQPCLEHWAQVTREEEAQRGKATPVVSCPPVEGKALRVGTVVLAATGKEMETDGDAPGVGWTLSRAVNRQHVRQKLVLSCSYGKPGYAEDPDEILEKRTVPIPAAARSCEREHRTIGNIEEIRCSTSPGAEDAAPGPAQRASRKRP